MENANTVSVRIWKKRVGHQRKVLFPAAMMAVAAIALRPNAATAANDAYSTDATSGLFSNSFTLGTNTPTAGGTSSPASGDSLFFGAETTGTTAVSNDLTGFTFAGFTFNLGASAFTIGGNAFVLSGGITNSSTSIETINNNITLSATQTVSASTGTIVLGGIVDSGGSTAIGLTKTGSGVLVLSAANTYAGPTNVTAGEISYTTGSSANSAATISGNVTTVGALDILFNNSAILANSTVTRLSSLTLANGDNRTTYNGLRVTGSTTNNTLNSTDAISGALNITGTPGTNAVETATTGVGNVTLTPSGGTGLTTLNVGSVNRGPGTILNVNAGVLGTSEFFRITGGTTPTLIGGGGASTSATASIVPWATQTNNGFLTYDPANGFVVAGTTGTFTQGTPATAYNFKQAGGTTTLTQNSTINSYVNGTSISTVTGAFTLNVLSGAMLFSQPTILSTTTLALGSAEGIFVQDGRNVAITSVITGTGGLTLTRSQGGGTAGGNVAFAFGGANTYSGVTTLTGGGGGTELVVGNANALQNTTLNDVGGALVFGTSATNQPTLGAVDIAAANFGGLAGPSPIALTNNGPTSSGVLLTVGSDNDSTLYSGVLSGSVAGNGIVKTGSGTLSLANTASTYSGSTTINQGILNVAVLANGSSNSSIGSSTGVAANLVLNGGTLQYTGAGGTSTSRAYTLGANGGTFDSSGAGLLTLSGADTNAAASGTVPLTLTGTTSGLLSGLVADGASAATSLVKNGTGTWSVTGANTFTGITSINNGALSVNAVATLTSAQPLGENAGLNLGSASTGGTLVYTGGSGTLDKAIALGTAGGTLSMNGSNDLNLTGTITGSGNITVNGTQAHNVVFAGANNSNSFTGNLIVTAQTVRPGTSANPFNASNTLSIQSGANFNIAGSSGVTFAGLNDIAGATGGGFVGGSAGAGTPLNLGGGGNYSFSGPITFNGRLNKTGSGTQILTGSNTYSGITTISGGNLQINNLTGSATSTGAVGLSGGTTTTLSGTGTSAGTLTVNAGSRIAPGINGSGANNNFGSASAITLGTAGGVTLTSANLDYDLSGTALTGNDSIVTAGTFTLTSVAFNFNETDGALDTANNYVLVSGASPGGAVAGTTFSGITTNFIGGPAYTPTYTTNGSDLEVAFSAAATPEPGSLGMLAFAGLAMKRRRRR